MVINKLLQLQVRQKENWLCNFNIYFKKSLFPLSSPHLNPSGLHRSVTLHSLFKRLQVRSEWLITCNRHRVIKLPDLVEVIVPWHFLCGLFLLLHSDHKGPRCGVLLCFFFVVHQCQKISVWICIIFLPGGFESEETRYCFRSLVRGKCCSLC